MSSGPLGRHRGEPRVRVVKHPFASTIPSCKHRRYTTEHSHIAVPLLNSAFHLIGARRGENPRIQLFFDRSIADPATRQVT